MRGCTSLLPTLSCWKQRIKKVWWACVHLWVRKRVGDRESECYSWLVREVLALWLMGKVLLASLNWGIPFCCTLQTHSTTLHTQNHKCTCTHAIRVTVTLLVPNCRVFFFLAEDFLFHTLTQTWLLINAHNDKRNAKCSLRRKISSSTTFCHQASFTVSLTLSCLHTLSLNQLPKEWKVHFLSANRSHMSLSACPFLSHSCCLFHCSAYTRWHLSLSLPVLHHFLLNLSFSPLFPTCSFYFMFSIYLPLSPLFLILVSSVFLPSIANPYVRAVKL